MHMFSGDLEVDELPATHCLRPTTERRRHRCWCRRDNVWQGPRICTLSYGSRSRRHKEDVEQYIETVKGVCCDRGIRGGLDKGSYALRVEQKTRENKPEQPQPGAQPEITVALDPSLPSSVRPGGSKIKVAKREHVVTWCQRVS